MLAPYGASPSPRLSSGMAHPWWSHPWRSYLCEVTLLVWLASTLAVHAGMAVGSIVGMTADWSHLC